MHSEDISKLKNIINILGIEGFVIWKSEKLLNILKKLLLLIAKKFS